MFQKRKKEIPDSSYDNLVERLLSDSEFLVDISSQKPQEEAPKNTESTEVTRWQSRELNDLTEEYSAQKMSEEDMDEKLLLALGYLSDDTSAQKLAKPQKLTEQVFGLKKEFSDIGEIPTIKERFKKQNKSLRLRLAVTLLAAFTVFLYPLVCSIMASHVQFFNTSIFFNANAFIVMQIAFIAAAFSAKELIKGLLKAIVLRSNVYSAPAILFVFLTVAQVLIAFLCDKTSGLNVSLFWFPAILSLVLPILSDAMRMKVQESTFDRLNANVTDCKDVYHLSENDGNIFLEKNVRDSDFYERTSRRYTDPRIMNLLLIPGSVFSVIAGLFTFFITNDTASAFATASTCICIIIPSSMLMNYYPFFSASSTVLSNAGASVVGRSSVDPLAKCDCITVNERDIFTNDAVTALNMELFNDSNLFDMIYYTASALRDCNTAFSSLFMSNADSIELSSDYVVTESCESGFTAVIDKSNIIQIGRFEYMEECGVEIPPADIPRTNDGQAIPIYIASNGALISYFSISYTPSTEFLHIAQNASASNVKLRILSSDFCVTEALIRSKLGLSDDMFELVKNDGGGAGRRAYSTLAVSVDAPAILFTVNRICKAVKKAERAVFASTVATSCLSVLVSLLITIFGFGGISPYVIAIYNALMVLPAFVLTKSTITDHAITR